MRVVLLSHSATGFAILHEVCESAGCRPVAYVYARSLRPNGPARDAAPERAAELVESVSPGLDLLLPGSGKGLVSALPGYQPDLIVCLGFSWRLPKGVLQVPRLGAINVHPSLLPKYRGPIPIHWAIRNGDPELGVTVHWMDENFDTGRVIVQRSGIPLPDQIEPDELLRQADDLSSDLLVTALELVQEGCEGEPQDEAAATYAGWMEEEFSFIDLARPARDIHNQVRTFQFGVSGRPGPVIKLDGDWVAVLRTRLEQPADGSGVRVECADGPLWITASEPAGPPSNS